jgi:hypothetical protein
MRGPAGWVLNLGGAHGTPGIATPENVVRISKSKKKPSGAARWLAGNPEGPNHYFEAVFKDARGNLHKHVMLGYDAEEAEGKLERFARKKWGSSIMMSIREVGRPNSKGNPNSASESAALAESFHGAPQDPTIAVDDIHYHDNLATLGQLSQLKVDTPAGRRVDINFTAQDAVTLASSPDGRQLYFIGGNQDIPLEPLGLNSAQWKKDSMTLGNLLELTYRTEKGFDKFNLTDYYHKLGEETGVKPVLLYDRLNRSLSVSGGQYAVKPEGLTN